MKELQKLLQMLTYKRPAGSKAEISFIKRYVLPLGARAISGNYVIEIPGDPDTMFSCHTDTVHTQGGTQQVLLDSNLQIAYKQDKECLGADDTAGVWLMLEMIKARVPGTYLFHYGEEKGCIGSRALALSHPELLRKFKRAIAFDRRGTTNIITFQHGQRCCSDIFGSALGEMLKHGYKNDPTGLYTDTASYTKLIPECTNISVGYEHQHCSDETLDCGHLLLLREIVMDVKWHQLPVDRDPAAPARYLAPVQSYFHKKWDPARTRLSTLTENECDDEEMAKLMVLANDEINELYDATKITNSEPALAGRMLYAFVMWFYACKLRMELAEKQKAANDPAPPKLIVVPKEETTA